MPDMYNFQISCIYAAFLLTWRSLMAVATSYVTAKPNQQTSNSSTIPQNLHAVPLSSRACLCSGLNATYASFLLSSHCSRLGQVPYCALSPPSSDLQDAMFIFPLFVPGKEFCDVRRGSTWRIPQHPEQRSEG